MEKIFGYSLYFTSETAAMISEEHSMAQSKLISMNGMWTYS